MLPTLSQMSTQEADECKNRADTSRQALKAYYQQPWAAQYNFNEALDALVTLADRSQKTVHSEQQKKFLELSNKPTLALYMGFPEQLLPSEIKKPETPTFYATPRERSHSRPTQGGQESIFQTQKVKTQSGLKGLLPQERKPQCSKDQRDPRTIESLQFFYQVCVIEDNLLHLFNKLNGSEYINGIVNLSSHTLTNTDISVLPKELGFCPLQGHQILAILSMTWMLSKEELDFNYFSLVPIRIHQKGTPNWGYHLNISPSNLNHPSIQ